MNQSVNQCMDRDCFLSSSASGSRLHWKGSKVTTRQRIIDGDEVVAGGCGCCRETSKEWQQPVDERCLWRQPLVISRCEARRRRWSVCRSVAGWHRCRCSGCCCCC